MDDDDDKFVNNIMIDPLLAATTIAERRYRPIKEGLELPLSPVARHGRPVPTRIEDL